MTLFQPKNTVKLGAKLAQKAFVIASIALLSIPNVVFAQSNSKLAYFSQNTVTNTVESTVSISAKTSGDKLVETETGISFDTITSPDPDKVVRSVITAYNSVPGQTDDTPCITADGTDLCTTKSPTVAANWLPFGTKVKIPSLFGDKIFVVHDRMNKRYGYGRMDVWFDASVAEARKFGVQRVDVEIYLPDTELAQR